MTRHIKGVRQALLGAGLMAGALFGLVAGPAVAADSKTERTPCFYVTQWNGWKSPSENVIYLGVNMHDVYRVDLSAGSSLLQWPDSHLISTIRGSDSICTALDLQLEISDLHGFREPLIATKLTKLTPEEIAAIPKKYRPN